MKKNISWIALTLGLIFSIVLFQFSVLNSTASASLPILLSLFMAEIGFLFCAYAAFLGGKELKTNGMNLKVGAMLLGNILVALNLASMGLALWQLIQGV
jgi:hypothetical protein